MFFFFFFPSLGATSGGFCRGYTTGLFAQQPGRRRVGLGGGSDNDKSEQTKGGSQEEIACLPEMCDSCCWKRGRKLENETIQEALRNRWIGTLAPPPDFPVESLPLSPPDLSF